MYFAYHIPFKGVGFEEMRLTVLFCLALSPCSLFAKKNGKNLTR